MRIEERSSDDPEQLSIKPTWLQRRWDRVPLWARIAAVSIAALLIVNLLLIVRIDYGLQDPPEVAAIRGPGRSFSLPAELVDWKRPETWFAAVYYGTRGLSANDVGAVQLGTQANDELVAHIGRHFPNVISLSLSGGHVTPKGLMALKDCPKIEFLEVSDCEIDDGIAALLIHLPELHALHVSGTSIGDAFTLAAAQHERLRFCDITLTEITSPAVGVWKTAQPSCSIKTDFGEYAMQAAIRWVDGEVTRRFSGPSEIRRYTSSLSDRPNEWIASKRISSSRLWAAKLAWTKEEFQNEADGNYQYRLKLGDIEAEPADFVIKDGKPIPDRLEFRMPVTRVEAERQSPSL